MLKQIWNMIIGPSYRSKDKILSEYDKASGMDKMTIGGRLSLEVACDIRDMIAAKGIVINPVQVEAPVPTVQDHPSGTGMIKTG